MLFTTAGITCNPLIPPVAAFIISFFTSMGGISGAFLLLPFQMSFLGYVNPSVSATNQFFNVVATPSGVWRYAREGRLVWPLALAVAVGTLPGVFIGALIRVNWLPDPKAFTIFAGFVLLYIGGRMARDLCFVRRKTVPLYTPVTSSAGYATWELHRPSTAQRDSKPTSTTAFPRVRLLACSLREVRYSYNDDMYAFSVQGVLSLTFVVGIIGGMYGIGGGAIISPFLVTAFGLPVHTVAGAALLGTFLTSAAAVVFYMAIAPWYPAMSISPDFTLGILLGIGGMAGIYCGARCQKYVPASAIKVLLTVILLFTAVRYLSNIF